MDIFVQKCSERSLYIRELLESTHMLLEFKDLIEYPIVSFTCMTALGFQATGFLQLGCVF